MSNLKIYVWDGVFCDWTCGLAFAIAETKEEAIELIDKAHFPWAHNELNKVEPEVFELTEKIAFAVSGGA